STRNTTTNILCRTLTPSSLRPSVKVPFSIDSIFQATVITSNVRDALELLANGESLFCDSLPNNSLVFGVFLYISIYSILFLTIFARDGGVSRSEERRVGKECSVR